MASAPGTRPLNAVHDDDPEGYDALRQGWLTERRAQRVEQTLAATTGPVLEIGAGTGGLLARLAAAHPDRRFVGVEPLANYVDYARAQVAGVATGRPTFVVGTGEDLPDLPSGTVPVGAVLTNDTLHHVRDLARVVRQVTRVGRRGTRWLAIEPDRVNPYVWAHHRLVPGEANFAPAPFERLLAAWGWRRVGRHRLFLVPPAVRRPPRWMQAAERRFEGVPGVAGGLALEYELFEAPRPSGGDDPAP